MRQEVDLRATATDLYSLLPGDFTAARNAKAKEASQSGDKELGKQIRTLPKPSTAAWLVNMLVRERRDQIDGVLQLGASLRQAQQELNQQRLRELGGQRHTLLSGLVDQARSLAGGLDHKVSDAVADDLEQTLHAAMADEDAANAVSSGMLTRALSSTGWEPVDLEGAVAVPEALERRSAAGTPPQSRRSGQKKVADKKTAKDKAAEVTSQTTNDESALASSPPTKARKPKETEEAARRLEKARSDLEQAEQRVQEAESRQHSTEEQLEEADSRQEKLADEIDKLKNRLREIEREQKDIEGEVERLEGEQDDALQAAKDARRDVRRARRKVNELS